MNIREVTLKALKEGRGMTRKSYGFQPPILLPTNTDKCVIVIPFNKKKIKLNRWNPNLDDLLAEDWYVYG